MTDIEPYTFEDCSGLVDIVFPDKVERVKEYAFIECANIETITFGKNLKNIGNNAFRGGYNKDYERTLFGSKKIKEIYCTNPNPSRISNVAFEDDVYTYATLYVPTGCKDKYKETEGWSKFWNIEEKDYNALEVNKVDQLMVEGNRVINSQSVVIDIYDVSGKSVYHGNDLEIVMPSKGLYIVRYGIKSQKFMVK